ncbi:TonB-dependent receptor domain-containing protein [Tenacibaculum sp. IB213877]|uniref:TonB-dependent receptor domain-containing protein n=1 Tax=Tenacibaculum sp. IB213877 TaxID=3097351 RepID=UPI002A59B62E|nr:TonB-dependent receptor [Tenacibaculum sp. IB213877]MDY0781541.1 TonB-dependent receptor plug domain-containing protein [Tenacibaculum sp. IB213877]
MSKSLKITLSYFLFLIGSFILKAQEKQPIKQLLPVIEKKYNVSFSYADNTIKNVTVNLILDDLSLNEILDAIEIQTELQFNNLDDTYITITKKPTVEKFKFHQLEEVVVNNYLTSGIHKNNNGSITLKPEQFGILPGLTEPDVLHSIQALPGIVSVDETVSNINVRGGTHDQNLILYDGIRMYQSGHFFGLISAFNPRLTKEVSIIKNGSSAKYGESISGIVDMKMDDEINEEEYGLGVNLINIDGYAIIPFNEKTAIQIAARRSITDAINTPTYDQYFKRIFQDSDLTNANDASISKNESFYFYDTSLKFLYDLTEKDNIRINFLNVYNKLNYEEESTVNSETEASESQLKQQNLALGITYNRTWNEDFTTSAQAYFTKYDLDATNYDILNNQRLIQENKVIEGGFKLDANYNFSPTFSLNSGINFSEVGISNFEDVNNPVFQSYIKYVLHTIAAYSEGTYESENKNTLIKLGLRHNYFRKFDKHLLEPRLHISQLVFNHFRVDVSAELKSQSSSQIIDLQNDFLGIEKRRWVLANNTTIPIQQSKQASIGFRYHKNKLLMSLETYAKKVDGITTRSQGFQNQYQFVNDIGNYEIYGIDMLINKRFNNFSTWLSYSFSENNYTFNNLNSGNKFPNNFDITHRISFAGTYQWKGLKTALGLNWRSGKPYTKPDSVDGDVITYQEPNSSRLDDYLRLDFSSTYQFNLGKHQGKVGLSLWNVLDNKNVLNAYFTAEDDMISTVENYSLGITPNLSFSVVF